MLDVSINDVVRLKKPHPCGSTDWTVVRIGADIGLRCTGCERRIMIPRRTLEKRMKAFVSRAQTDPDSPSSSSAQVDA